MLTNCKFACKKPTRHAGTQVRLADIRYATNGLQIIGQPLHSPLLGEDYEAPGDNDTLAARKRSASTATPRAALRDRCKAIGLPNRLPVRSAAPPTSTGTASMSTTKT